jgi:hypothetical protein
MSKSPVVKPEDQRVFFPAPIVEFIKAYMQENKPPSKKVDEQNANVLLDVLSEEGFTPGAFVVFKDLPKNKWEDWKNWGVVVELRDNSQNDQFTPVGVIWLDVSDKRPVFYSDLALTLVYAGFSEGFFEL